MEIYLDNASTTKLDGEIYKKMKPFFEDRFYNPSSIYANDVKRELENARARAAISLGCVKDEIYFTSSATESNNWAVKGVAMALKERGKHIIISQIEHPSILETCKFMEKNGYDVTYLPVNNYGVVDITTLSKSIRQDTVLISIMAANNEIGTIQPIFEIGEIAKKNNILFHCDAVQAIGKIDINLSKNNISLLTLSGHKINGPKGSGLLYIKYGTPIVPLLHGGGQENKLRSGTENIANCVGLSYAILKATSEIDKKSRQKVLRDELIEKLLNLPSTKLIGHPKNRLPNNVNILFEGVDGKYLVHELYNAGIKCSVGSACNCGDKVSHVLLACGITERSARSAVRFTFDDDMNQDKIDYCVKTIRKTIEKFIACN